MFRVTWNSESCLQLYLQTCLPATSRAWFHFQDNMVITFQYLCLPACLQLYFRPLFHLRVPTWLPLHCISHLNVGTFPAALFPHIIPTLSPTVVSFTGILKRLFSTCHPLCPPLEPCNIVSQLSFNFLPTISLLFSVFCQLSRLSFFHFSSLSPLTFQFFPNCLPLCLTAVCTNVFVLTLSPNMSLAWSPSLSPTIISTLSLTLSVSSFPCWEWQIVAQTWTLLGNLHCCWVAKLD